MGISHDVIKMDRKQCSFPSPENALTQEIELIVADVQHFQASHLLNVVRQLPKFVVGQIQFFKFGEQSDLRWQDLQLVVAQVQDLQMAQISQIVNRRENPDRVMSKTQVGQC